MHNPLKQIVNESQNPLGLRDVLFMEMAGPDRSILAHTLEAAGFQPIRKHRSKKITLYILDKFYVMLHETSAPLNISLGFAVEDVDSALQAAAEMSVNNAIEIHASGPVGPMGLHIPAVRFAGQGYFYIVDATTRDRFFALDFVQL
jgi:4-hydroxyphenylpyruvate dioxygenase